MEFFHLKNAFLIGFFMAFMIGPVFFMLLQTSILKGAKAAIIFDLGVILGDITFILISYFGSRSLLEKIKDDTIARVSVKRTHPKLSSMILDFVTQIYQYVSYL